MVSLYVVLILGGMVLTLWGLHRLALYLESIGHLYYTKRPEGGSPVGGVLQEIEKIVRPSVQHVEEGKHRTQKQERAAPGGEPETEFDSESGKEDGSKLD